MRKVNIILVLLGVAILSGCKPNETTINFSQPEKETIIFEPVNELQHLSGFSQVNISDLEGFENITDADIFIPIPNDAVWDAKTKTYTLPDNYVNENGESFVMTISLESLPEGVYYNELGSDAKEEVERLKKQDRIKYSGSGYIVESNVVVKGIMLTELEEPSTEDGEEVSTEKLKKTVKYTVDAYDFLAPTYYLNIQVEVVKLRGTVDDTTDSYFAALKLAEEKLKIHYQED